MWLFEQYQTAGQSGITTLAHDGRDVWAANATQIKVWSYLDEEYLAQEYQLDNGLFAMKEVATIEHGSAVDKMECSNGVMYVLSGAEIKAYSTTTYTQIGSVITTPVAMQSEMCIANNKIWFVSLNSDQTSSLAGIVASDCQQLYFYDLISQTWSSPVLIPGKKQYITRKLVDGLDGYIYITGMNDHAVVKFSTSGAYVGTYRVNRHPYLLHANQNKDVFVVSDAQSDILKGMVSVFDQSTNTSSNFAAACGTIEYMADVGDGRLVYVGGTPKLAILNKSDKKLKYVQDPASEDFVPGAAIQLAVTPLRGLVTPSLTFDVWTGSAFASKTVKPYVFFSTSSTLYAARLSSLVRVNSMDVLGTAMIATGAQNYYGDIV